MLALGATSKAWRETCHHSSELWLHLSLRDHPPTAAWDACAATEAAAAGAGGAVVAAYRHSHLVRAMRRVLRKPAEVSPQSLPYAPRPSEGHASCSWGRGSSLVFGGFCRGGATERIYLLSPATALRHGSSGRGGASSSAPAPAAAAGSASSTCYRWLRPRITGAPPLPRYGHTLSRCGRNGELAVVFGGMLLGGYDVRRGFLQAPSAWR